VDAYLSSNLVETGEADSHYSERLIRASTMLTYQTPVALPAKPKPREFFGEAFSGARHLYGCVQNLGKFHPDFDPVLADILRRDPLGVIVAARDQNGYAAGILQSRWRREMPEVAHRIILTDPLKQADYLSLLAACDVLLDPLHFGGVTTTYDALALHQPVVTLPTPFHRGRYTAACLRKIGVTQTIARDCDDYAALAVALAEDSVGRRALQRQLRDATGPLFADQTAVGEHERILEELLAAGR
jgi:predicted O-linked N-acetylglucosamine transferase (SPINDLY family)